MRTIRHALDELGHETFVLAKPTAEDFELPNFVSSDDVWADHHHLTHASATSIPTDEYLAWASANDLDVALFFQNIDFDGINALSVSGVRTIGTYMWEAFGPDEAPQADAALDLIYAMHPASKTWFEELGLRNVPVVRFVSHPEVAAARVDQHR